MRLTEGLFLQVGDIDGARKLVHVHRGKGARDRYVPLPERTLGMLCEYWRDLYLMRFIRRGRAHSREGL